MTMTATTVKNELAKSSSLKELVMIPYKALEELLAREKSGKLIIDDPYNLSQQWIIYLGKGTIHFATCKNAKKERLIYLLSQCFSEHNFYIPQEIEDDYQFIYQQWRNKRLDSKKARKILSYFTQEAIIRCLTLPKTKIQFDRVMSLDPLILNSSLKSIVNPVKEKVRSWVQIRGYITSPFVRLNVKSWEEIKDYFTDNNQLENINKLESLKPYLDDNCTLYEMASYTQQSTLELALFFQPLVSLNFITINPYQTPVTVDKPIIACIDDSNTIQRIVKMTLLTGGFEVLSITEPAKAMSLFIRQKPDLILMDINMPDIDGYKLAYMLRQSPLLQDIPILMLTGRDRVLDRVKAKMVGAVGYICKPFNPQELIKTIQDNLQVHS